MPAAAAELKERTRAAFEQACACSAAAREGSGVAQRLGLPAPLSFLVSAGAESAAHGCPGQAEGSIPAVASNGGASSTETAQDAPPLKISVVTTVYNDVRVGRALESILCQRHDCALELIVIDAGSDDGTLDVLERYRDRLSVLVSEPDRGMYDGMNKGVSAATGDIVGILNADDRYADADVLRDVAAVFRRRPEVQVCYGDLVYVSGKDEIARYWKSGANHRMKWRFGWRPPHPTFFVRRSVYQKYGLFNADYEIGGDYDMQLRLLFKHGVASTYIPRVLVRMALGGASTGKLRGIVKAHLEAVRAWRMNGLWGASIVLVLKPVIKIAQRFRRPR